MANLLSLKHITAPTTIIKTKMWKLNIANHLFYHHDNIKINNQYSLRFGFT